jgi:signal transduction histidine kinase
MRGGASAGTGALTGIGMTKARSALLSQLPLTGATALIVAGVGIFAPHYLQQVTFLVGALIVLAVTALAIAVPWNRLPGGWAIILPILDIGAIALMQNRNDVRFGVLLVLPVIWMSSAFRTAGAILGSVLALAAAWGSSFPEFSALTITDTSRVLLLPLVLVFVAAMTAGMASRAAAQQRMLARQGELLSEALEQAKSHRRVLDGILNAVDFGIVRLSADGTQSWLNQQGRALTGRAGDTAPSELRFYTGDRVPLDVTEHPISRAAAGETFERSVLWIDAADGGRRAMSVSAQQLHDENGERTGAVVVFQDVTSEIDALHAREELVGAVSHELRTPLTSIVGYLELTLDEPDLAEGPRTYATIAAENADRMLRLISDMLVAASAVEGKLVVLRRDMDLGAAVADAVRSIAPRAAERGITVANEVPNEQHVYADESRMRQVLDNLLSNAVKYGKQGGRVRIAFREDERESVLSVQDDGIGIAEADQARLFDRFFRVVDTRGGVTSGTGLGLAISRAIVREHGGDIRVASTLGEGTTVSVVLPRREEGT